MIYLWAGKVLLATISKSLQCHFVMFLEIYLGSWLLLFKHDG